MGRTLKIGIAIVLIAAAVFGILLLLSRADIGARLDFLGAVLGAAMTVAGSVIVLDWQAKQTSRRTAEANRATLRELLQDVLKNVDRIDREFDTSEWTAGKIMGPVDDLNRKIRVVQDTRQWVVPDYAPMVRAFGYIGSMAQIILENEEPGTAQRPQVRASVIGHLKATRTWARAALRELSS